MVKYLNVWGIFKQIQNCKVYMNDVFPAQHDYKKLLMRDELDHSIVHVRTNELNSEVSSKSI